MYRNPLPHLSSRHAFSGSGSVSELPGGDLVSAMDIGSALEAVDVRL